MDELARKALHAIDGLALMHAEVFDYERADKAQIAMDIIYRLAHTAVAVNCRKNHPTWIKEAEEMYEAMVEAGYTRPIDMFGNNND